MLTPLSHEIKCFKKNISNWKNQGEYPLGI